MNKIFLSCFFQYIMQKRNETHTTYYAIKQLVDYEFRTLFSIFINRQISYLIQTHTLKGTYLFTFDFFELVMGRLFLEHMGGHRLFSCANCDTVVTNRSRLISTRFTGSTGRAYLFEECCNLFTNEIQERVSQPFPSTFHSISIKLMFKLFDQVMLTGRHFVRDVFCKKCASKLGWMYEYATEHEQRYKEGHVILERALISESEGL